MQSDESEKRKQAAIIPHKSKNEGQRRDAFANPSPHRGSTLFHSSVVADGNPCICDWVDCGKLRKMFSKYKHPDFGGRCIEVRISDTCDTLNFLKCACRNLHLPPNVTNDIMQEAISMSSNGSSVGTQTTHSEGGHKQYSRIQIAKHHFTPGMFEMKRTSTAGRWSWVQPILESDAVKYECLASNFREDDVVVYDSSLSNKSRNGRVKSVSEEQQPKNKSRNRKVRSGSEEQQPKKYIKAPCAGKEEVLRIASELNNPSVKHRKDPVRSQEEWMEITKAKDMEIANLKRKLEESEMSCQQLNSDLQSLKKSFRAAKKSHYYKKRKLEKEIEQSHQWS